MHNTAKLYSKPITTAIEAVETRLLFSSTLEHIAALPALPMGRTIHHSMAHVKPAHHPAGKNPMKSVKAHKVNSVNKADHLQTSAIVFPDLYLSDIKPTHLTQTAINPLDGGAATAPFTPAQIRHFYGIDHIAFNGIAGDGAGETIAVVDAFDQPDLVNSTDPNFKNSDLYHFDQTFGLPNPPSFVKIDEYGGNNTPTTHRSDWSFEETLDVEWAHAIAPAANIVLVECADDSDNSLLTQGVNTARNYPGVVAVSMSFYEPEFDSETDYDPDFNSTAVNPGVSFFACTGDNGAANSGYPAFSPKVVAVGGTSIITSDSSGSYGSEVVWNSSNGTATGGAPSAIETKPTYQNGIALGGTMRATPDVSLVADPSTGVFIYDTAEDPNSTYYQIGGTSLSSPAWAALVAITDQGRSLAGSGPMDGFTQTLPRLYTLPASDFHDIVTGNNNGYSAAAGYDLASGLGTPIANQLVPDLAGADTITGRVFIDNNSDGTLNGSDTPVAAATVYLDLNNSGVQTAGDPTVVTNPSGVYTFADEIGGLNGTVRLSVLPAGHEQLPGATTFTTSYAATQSVNIDLFPTAYSDTTGTAQYTVGLDSTGADEQVSDNGTVLSSIPIANAPAMSFSFTHAGQTLTIDGTNGNPVPIAGIAFTGAAGGDTLNVVGTPSGNDSFAVNANTFQFNSNPIRFTSGSNLLLNPGTGVDALVVNSNTLTIPAGASGNGIINRRFSNITIGSTAKLVFATAPRHTDRMLVQTTSLSVQGQLDLGGNDAIIHNGNLAAITTLLQSGFAGGQWNGNGIASTAAGDDPAHLAALGMVPNNIGNGNTIYGGRGQPLFDGQAPTPGDLLIKYTYYGDANLDGQVDGSDYSRIDNAQLVPATGWFNGDFNYDMQRDGSDYALIDNAFNSQATAL